MYKHPRPRVTQGTLCKSFCSMLQKNRLYGRHSIPSLNLTASNTGGGEVFRPGKPVMSVIFRLLESVSACVWFLSCCRMRSPSVSTRNPVNITTKDFPTEKYQGYKRAQTQYWLWSFFNEDYHSCASWVLAKPSCLHRWGFLPWKKLMICSSSSASSANG